MRPTLDWLLVFAPAAVALSYAAPERGTAIFICACLAILPLAAELKGTGRGRGRDCPALGHD